MQVSDAGIILERYTILRKRMTYVYLTGRVFHYPVDG